jgi:hypothetical protein
MQGPDPDFLFDTDPDPASKLGAGDIREGKIKIRGIICGKEK